MTSAASEAAVVTPRGKAREAQRSQDAAMAAWACMLPCAAIAAAAILVLGPPLGHLLFDDRGAYTFLPAFRSFVHPEASEQGRYLVAIAVVPLACAAVVLAARAQSGVRHHRLAAVIATTTQALLAVLVAVALVAQYRLTFGPIYTGGHGSFQLHYFSPGTIACALVLAAAATATASSRRLRTHVVTLQRESRVRRTVVTAVALAATAVWVMPAVHSDASIAMAPEDVLYHLGFTLDETFAVLNGRTPLVDFTAQYGSLWPNVIALSMLAFGKTTLTFTIALFTIGALALLAIYGVLRRVTGTAVAALALYLPFLATSLFMIDGTLENRSTVGSYFGTFPLRYAGPWFVAWLTAWRLGRHGRKTGAPSLLLFTVAGVVALNNGDFGIAALGASVAALLWTEVGLPRRRLARLAGWVLGGIAIALALVCALTLVRAGSLPHLGRLFDYARLYAIGGYALMPIPGVLGVHLLIYVTYVAALVVATVRALRSAGNRVLTGMLAWIGVFGLGAGTYYVGRSHPIALKHQFSAWTLALTLLSVVAVGALASERSRRVVIGAFLALFGFGIAACSLAQAPTPWTQVARLNAPFVQLQPWRAPDPFVPPADAGTRMFVASLADGPSQFATRPGAPVAILLTTGHRIADRYGVVDVAPYTGIQSLETAQRVEATLDALRDAGGNTVILPAVFNQGLFALLERRGFRVLTPAGLRRYVPGSLSPVTRPWPIDGGIIKWVDTRHLHPRALR
jgi:hypothetical protein